MHRRGLLAALGGAALSCTVGGSVHAQAYPARPIRLIVPFAPAGNIDLNARLVGEAMSRRLGQQVVIENRAGAGGVVGAEAAARAAPDGYTIVMGSTGTFLVSPLLAPTPPYSLDSFVAIGSVSAVPMLLEARAGGRFADYASVAAFVKANPEQVSLGHAGNGTTNHIALLQLQLATGLRFNVIPYRGSGPALNDLLGGQIELIVDQVSSSLAHIRAGRLKPLAVTSRARSPDLLDVPTLAELGVGGFEAVTLSGLMAPAGTPASAVKTLNTALNDALGEPEVRKRLAELGAEPRPQSPEDFAAFMREEDKRMRALHQAGLFKIE
jgi:tripartite-type tricarboxylate transporter receptor subunit TctC